MFNFLLNKKIAIKENWHEEFVSLLAKLLRPQVYVELGLYHCELFNKVVPFADKLIGVDNDSRCESFMKKSDKTHFVNKTTQAYARLLQKKPLTIDMLFIDADHRSESVLNDFRTYFPYIKEQGIILIHDTYPKNKKYTADAYCSDSYRAVEELGKKTRAYECMTLPVHPGLTICRKRKKQLAWNKK